MTGETAEFVDVGVTCDIIPNPGQKRSAGRKKNVKNLMIKKGSKSPDKSRKMSEDGMSLTS